ncbi:helix-turn-helix domain-containing protein [Phocaeicola sp. HCN-40430]|uniref:helix-turn-helix domain-containing protein n=1 Tax=Phocaeicola sp. HCN-40430 TaxID=3134664 RepID=UPI0030C2C2F7
MLELSESDSLKLEKGYHNSSIHNYRIRCKSILLKSTGKSASEIAEIFDVTVPTVYAWIKRYKENGIKGLKTRPGQGRTYNGLFR